MPGRILYIEETRNGIVGGSVICLLHMIRGMKREGYEPYVVLHSELPLAKEFEKYGKLIRMPKREPVQKWSTERPPSKIRVLGWLIRDLLLEILPGSFSLRLIIRREKIDIVHLNNGLGLDIEGIVAAKLSGVPCVVQERGIGKVSIISKWLARYVDALICVSNAVHRNLLDQGVQPKKYRMIYDGIDLDEEKAVGSKEGCRARWGLPPDLPVVGIVGTIQRWKGHHEVISAIKKVKEKIPNIKCVIVGGIYDPVYENELRHLVETLNLKDNIIFLGYQSNTLSVMNAMDIVVHASILPEPFGRVLIEAMSLGKPVIATKAGGPIEIIEDQVSGLLVPPSDPEALSDAIIHLLQDPSGGAEMGRSGRERVEKMFPLKRTIEEVRSLYAELK
jgi:glycosyltransferase involved in cell wall biosynthesis